MLKLSSSVNLFIVFKEICSIDKDLGHTDINKLHQNCDIKQASKHYVSLIIVVDIVLYL